MFLSETSASLPKAWVCVASLIQPLFRRQLNPKPWFLLVPQIYTGWMPSSEPINLLDSCFWAVSRFEDSPYCPINLIPSSGGESCLVVLTLYDSMDYTVHGILQARIPRWVAVPFSRGSYQPRDRTQVSHIAGRFFTSRATREAHQLIYSLTNTYVFYLAFFSSVQSLSHVWLFVTPWTASRQASLSITSSRRLLKLISI